MKREKTIVNFILDKSGSMDNVREATISGFNEYIGTLKNDKESEYEFTLTLFDTDVTTPVRSENVRYVSDLSKETYRPDGMTALYDAVCQTIRDIRPGKTQKVVSIIMTDGLENSSKEYTHTHMRDMIKEREKQGNWKFVYLGANQDSYANAATFGIRADSVTNFHATDLGIKNLMRTVASNTTMYSASAMNNDTAFFTKADQESLETTK